MGVNMLLAGLLIWTIISILYVISRLGEKNNPEPDPWYIWVLGMPALILAYLFGTLEKCKKWYKGGQ